MKEITVMGSTLILRDGIVKLTPAQASARAHCLKPLLDKKGKQIKDCYEITTQICFKVGEVIGYTGDVGDFSPEMALQIQADKKDAVIGDLREKIQAKDTELVEIRSKLEKMAKINQELLKKNEKLEAAK